VFLSNIHAISVYFVYCKIIGTVYGDTVCGMKKIE